MSPDRWSRIRRLHGEAADLPPGERRAYLESQCGDDPSIVEEVWALLETKREDDFLEAPIVEKAARAWF